LGGDSFDQGLGTHSQCRLSYDLAGGFHYFETWVGLDDRTGQEGSVHVRVLVDGQVRADIRELTWSKGPERLWVEVRGARELALEVNFGLHADVQDHVDWAEARLVR